MIFEALMSLDSAPMPDIVQFAVNTYQASFPQVTVARLKLTMKTALRILVRRNDIFCQPAGQVIPGHPTPNMNMYTMRVNPITGVSYPSFEAATVAHLLTLPGQQASKEQILQHLRLLENTGQGVAPRNMYSMRANLERMVGEGLLTKVFTPGLVWRLV